jgi:hypothetical protein
MQSGQVVIELIASLLVFVIMIALTISISVYLYFQHALVTAAREGARQAALSTELGTESTEDSGIVTVKEAIKKQILQTTGQPFSDEVATITVRPPSQSVSQTAGERDVAITINWALKNPVAVSGFLTALGADGSAFSNIPIYAIATMRYEE